MSAKLAKSKRYQNLFRDEASQVFYFRKYSKVKGKQFFRATGEAVNEARAYRIGLEAFNEWLGKLTDESGVVYFGKYARRYLNLKLDDPSIAPNTKQAFKNQLVASTDAQPDPRPRLIDAFGHYPIDKITNEAWKRWTIEILEDRPAFKFFNARKALIEILRDAFEQGHLQRVPQFDNPDSAAAPPRELKREEIRALFRACNYVVMNRARGGGLAPVQRKDGKGVVREHNWIKLLLLIMWKQGARPGEILQYEWDMIRFDEDVHGRIHIPARITKTRRSRVIVLNASVSRVLKFLRGKAQSPFLFPSPDDPARALANYNKTWEGVCRRAKLAAQIYWFRDTWVTRKIKEGHSLVFIAKYIDSSVVMLEQKYAVSSDETMRDVAE